MSYDLYRELSEMEDVFFYRRVFRGIWQFFKFGVWLLGIVYLVQLLEKWIGLL
jgi:hypothetical protein